jgi:hypothetical protein
MHPLSRFPILRLDGINSDIVLCAACTPCQPTPQSCKQLQKKFEKVKTWSEPD